MKARLNLSTKPTADAPRFLAASGVVGAIASLFFLGLGWHVYSIRRADAALRKEPRPSGMRWFRWNSSERIWSSSLTCPKNARLHERSAFLNTLIDEQSLNWTQMFMDLEKILPAGVRVVEHSAEARKGPCAGKAGHRRDER